MDSYFRNLRYQEKIFWQFAKTRPAKARNILISALKLARRAHTGQTRDEGDPYFIHPLRTANFLVKNLKITDTDVICAALLHDVVEDTSVSIGVVKKQFGAKIGKLVNNLTRPRPKNETEQAKKISTGRKYRAIMRADKNTRVIKSADMLDNLRSMIYIPPGHPTRRKFSRCLISAQKYDIPLGRTVSDKMECEMRKAFEKAKKITGGP